MLTLNCRVVLTQDLLWSEVGEEVIMLDTEGGAYRTFDAIGSQIWKQVSTPVEIAGVCERLEQQYNAPPGAIQCDVLAFLDDLLKKNLIQVQA